MTLKLNAILINTGTIVSFAEGRRLVAQGGVTIDGFPALDLMQDVPDNAQVKVNNTILLWENKHNEKA